MSAVGDQSCSNCVRWPQLAAFFCCVGVAALFYYIIYECVAIIWSMCHPATVDDDDDQRIERTIVRSERRATPDGLLENSPSTARSR